MRTRMTEVFGVKYPMMLAGMAYVSLPKLVAAVSNAGGLGTYNSVANTPDEMRGIVREIRSLTHKPFSMNFTLLLPNARENAEVALEEKVPILNYALGKADWMIKAAHAYGGKVIATVATERYALKAQEDGADAIVITGYEAAAHGTEITTLILTQILRKRVHVPIIVAGGFCDGRGLAAALTLGADGISMGTRFVMTKECQAHDSVKKTMLTATENDTIYSEKIDGLPGRWFKTRATMEMAEGKLSVMKAVSSAMKVKKDLDVPMHKLLASGLKQKDRGVTDLARQALNVVGIKVAADTGDLDEGFFPVGQIVGNIHDEPTRKELLDRIVEEAREGIEETRKKVVS
ncbi:MAG: nitronate monooxygenase [Deltaproteobacteria bacterium]|nr:nitronate monooxygenase [Deltaproteobacteria bacterium]